MLFTEFPKNKTKKNYQKYVTFDDDEQFVFFYDESIFNTGKMGLSCTSKRIIRHKKDKIESYPLNSIKKIEAREIDKDRYIYKLIITDHEGNEFDLTPNLIANDEMKLIAHIIQLEKND